MGENKNKLEIVKDAYMLGKKDGFINGIISGTIIGFISGFFIIPAINGFKNNQSIK